MSFSSINTNTAAMVAVESLNMTNAALAATEKQVSTGYRVADATDDGAAYAVAQRVRSDVAALTSANQQLGNVQGLLDTTNTALNNVSNSLISARGLLIKLADSTLTSTERSQYQAQYTTAMQQIRGFFTDASYNGKTLIGNLPGSDTSAFGSVHVIRNEAGSFYAITTFSASAFFSTYSALTTASLGVTTALAYSTTTGSFNQAFDLIGSELNKFGFAVDYVTTQISYNSDKIDALNTGLGALIDADLTAESAQLQALQVRQQLGTQALSIANQAPQSLLSLFKGT